MSITDVAARIHNAVQRHTTLLEDVDFLPVFQCNLMLGIRQPNERDSLVVPVLLERFARIGSDREDFHAAAGELVIRIP